MGLSCPAAFIQYARNYICRPQNLSTQNYKELFKSLELHDSLYNVVKGTHIIGGSIISSIPIGYKDSDLQHVLSVRVWSSDVVASGKVTCVVMKAINRLI